MFSRVVLTWIASLSPALLSRLFAGIVRTLRSLIERRPIALLRCLTRRLELRLRLVSSSRRRGDLCSEILDLGA